MYDLGCFILTFPKSIVHTNCCFYQKFMFICKKQLSNNNTPNGSTVNRLRLIPILSGDIYRHISYRPVYINHRQTLSTTTLKCTVFTSDIYRAFEKKRLIESL